MLIKTYMQRESVVERLNKRYFKLEKELGINWTLIETSGAPGSFETFYVSFSPVEDEDRSITIRFSGHNAGSSCDYYLWNDDFNKINELYAAIDKIIKEVVK